MSISDFAAIAVSYVGLFIFLSGFFLTRRELGEISQYNAPSLRELFYSNDIISLIDYESNQFATKVSLQENESDDRQVFMFIVDALRLDFMTYQDVSVDKLSPSYNKFVNMHNLLVNNASQCSLFGFRADPPTVTSQRLKGLMTGTLPTFVDIGSNFNSSSITDDNIIDQMIRKQVQSDNKRIVLGDDTWVSVFPDQFHISHVFDSFNTKDLHTVDNGILHYLNMTLQTTHWELFVVHFLGVDHIGHSYHAHHPLMGERLALMDNLLMEIINQLPDNAILLLFGDHGMTDEGEHGGATELETDSGLFIYSKKNMFNVKCGVGSNRHELLTDLSCTTKSWNTSTNQFDEVTVESIRKAPRMISQIDLTPTLSQWLSISIPYSSLGKIIPEAFLFSGQNNENDLSEILFVNSMQVWRYFVRYFSDNKADETMSRLNSLLNNHRHCGRLSEIDESFNEAKQLKLSSTLQPLWNLLLDAVETHLISTCDSTILDKPSVALFYQFLTQSQEFGRNHWTEFNLVYIALGILLMLLSFFAVLQPFLIVLMGSVASNDPLDWCPVALAIFHAISVFSNSFIIEEHWVLLFAIQSIALSVAMKISESSVSSIKKCISIACGLILLFLARIKWTIPVTSSLDTGLSASVSSSDFPLSGYAVAFWLSINWFLINCIMKRYSPAAQFPLYDLISCVVLLDYWLIMSPSYSSSVAVKSILEICLPRIIFVQSLCVLCCFLYFGLLQWLMAWWRSFFWVVVLVSGSHSLTRLTIFLLHMSVFLHFCESCVFVRHPKGESNIRRGVFDLTLKDFKRAFRNIIQNNPPCLQSSISVTMLQVVGIGIYFNMVGRFVFYLTDHGMTFAKLKLSSGFIGLQSFDFIYSGILLALNTFGSDIFSMVTLIMVAKYWNHKVVIRDCTMSVENVLLRTTLVYRIALLLFSCGAAALHRRHLMVWAVFAPKVAFESAFWIVGGIVYVVVNICLRE